MAILRTGERPASVQALLYEKYASTHAGNNNPESERLAFERQILPHLPVDLSSSVVDLGCGQGELVRNLVDHGYSNAIGIDISPEQVEVAHQRGIHQVRQGDVFDHLESAPSSLDCILATDLLEHLGKPDILRLLDHIGFALRPGGTLVVRMPNAISPFAGNYQHGDFTHETAFTPRSFRQVALNSSFTEVRAYPCAPIAHGAISAARAVIWKGVSGTIKLALAAETGQLRGHIVTQAFLGVARR